jgi:hypothetical protein
MRRLRRSPQLPSPTEAVSLVRGATLARHGGSSTARLVNVANHLRTKKRLSTDYRPTKANQLVSEPKKSKKTNATPFESDDALHQQALDGMRHYLKHGDTGVLTKLTLEIESPTRRNAFVQWCAKHMAIEWHVKASTFKKVQSGKCGTIAAAMTDPLRLPRDPTSEARELHKVHLQAVKALEHAIDFGDWTGITGLVNAFYNQRRGEQLTCWFGAFGTFSLAAGRLRFSLRRPISAHALSSALQTPFFKFPVKRKRSENTGPIHTTNPMRCKVCGGPAMPGEDICYHDQSE